MPSPLDILKEELQKPGAPSPTELGRRLGYKRAYHGAYSILTGTRRFDEALQRRVAEALGLPDDHFSNIDEAKLRAAKTAATFAAFLKTEIGRGLSREVRRTLESMTFFGRQLPTVATYQALALTLTTDRYSEEQLAEAVRENEDLDKKL